MRIRPLARHAITLAAALAAPWALAGPTVNVTVADGSVSVSQKTVRAAAGDDAITWVLKTPGYAFASEGIVIDGDAPYRCAKVSATEMRCDKMRRSSGAKYSYQVNVQAVGGARSTLRTSGSDVWIQND
jgi:hypothetical protein